MVNKSIALLTFLTTAPAFGIFDSFPKMGVCAPDYLSVERVEAEIYEVQNHGGIEKALIDRFDLAPVEVNSTEWENYIAPYGHSKNGGYIFPGRSKFQQGNLVVLCAYDRSNDKVIPESNTNDDGCFHIYGDGAIRAYFAAGYGVPTTGGAKRVESFRNSSNPGLCLDWE